MTHHPLVSVIVPTYQSAQFLGSCLNSIRAQTYSNIELLVVDNHSTDGTIEIAKKLADHVLTKGPERSAQRNYGAQEAKGEYVYMVDSDFTLDSQVVEQCVATIGSGLDAIVVHNTPDESVSWIARIRKFEVDMYKYDLTHSAARFFKRDVFSALGGYDETITAGEDYDIQNRLNRSGYKTGFVDAEALHLGEPTSFWRHMKKYYEYGKDFVHYQNKNSDESTQQLGFARSVYLRHWQKFVRTPLLGTGFIIYHVLKYMAGGSGYLVGKIRLYNV